ncbi:MAG: hypothetical protein J5598_01225 [Clostridia bacterium]|nr:hypothetical protein [Clostridia bacterium]
MGKLAILKKDNFTKGIKVDLKDLRKLIGAGLMAVTLMGCQQLTGNTIDNPTQQSGSQVVTPSQPTQPTTPTEPTQPTEPNEAELYGGEIHAENFNGISILRPTGENTVFTRDNCIDAAAYYYKETGKYMKGLANDFDKSLKGNTKNYFANLNNVVKNSENFYLSKNDPSNKIIGHAINCIDNVAQPYAKDMVKYLNNVHKGCTLETCFEYISNEAFKSGLGTYAQHQSEAMNNYETKKKKIIAAMGYNEDFNNLDVSQYGTHAFTKAVADIYNNLLDKIAENMNNDPTMNNNEGVNVKGADLQKLNNLILINYAVKGMCQTNEFLLENAGICLGIIPAMDKAITAAEYAEQNQEQTMGM